MFWEVEGQKVAHSCCYFAVDFAVGFVVDFVVDFAVDFVVDFVVKMLDLTVEHHSIH